MRAVRINCNCERMPVHPEPFTISHGSHYTWQYLQDGCLLGCDASSGMALQMFPKNLLPPSSELKSKQTNGKRENRVEHTVPAEVSRLHRSIGACVPNCMVTHFLLFAVFWRRASVMPLFLLSLCCEVHSVTVVPRGMQ